MDLQPGTVEEILLGSEGNTWEFEPLPHSHQSTRVHEIIVKLSMEYWPKHKQMLFSAIVQPMDIHLHAKMVDQRMKEDNNNYIEDLP